MRNWIKATALAVTFLFASCSHVAYLGPPNGSPKRMWIVKGDKVYRCADGAANDEVPKPVCINAPLANPR